MSQRIPEGMNQNCLAVIQQIQEVGLTTYEAILALLNDEHQARNTIKDLKKSGVIDSHELFPKEERGQPKPYQRVFYRLTNNGCRLVGVPAKTYSGRPGNQSLTHRYATLSLCWLSNTKRQQLTKTDLQDQVWRGLGDTGKPNYFQEDLGNGQLRLGQAFVDWRASDVRRLERKVYMFFRNHRENEVLRQWVYQRKFHFVYVVAHKSKGQAIAAAAKQRKDLPVPVEYFVCPELGRLI